MDDIAEFQTTLHKLRSGMRRADWQHASAVHSARIGGLLRVAASAVGGYHGRARTRAGWMLFAQTAEAIVPVLRITRRGRSRTVHDLDELVVAVQVIAPELVDMTKLDRLLSGRGVKVVDAEATA